MLNILSMIPQLISKISSTKVKTTSQTVSEFVGAKTNNWAVTVIGFVTYQLYQNPDNYIYQGILIFCIYALCKRDTDAKIIKAMKGDSEND